MARRKWWTVSRCVSRYLAISIISTIHIRQHDFGLTARQGIALLATHATSGQFHNFRLPTKYMWPGNPYLTNMYFKYLAGVGMYR